MTLSQQKYYFSAIFLGLLSFMFIYMNYDPLPENVLHEPVSRPIELLSGAYESNQSYDVIQLYNNQTYDSPKQSATWHSDFVDNRQLITLEATIDPGYGPFQVLQVTEYGLQDISTFEVYIKKNF